jgi:hypothetical protein
VTNSQVSSSQPLPHSPELNSVTLQLEGEHSSNMLEQTFITQGTNPKKVHHFCLEGRANYTIYITGTSQQVMPKTSF